uniref:Putative RING-H2 zinc finger protein RHA1a n=1 Tax=Davidia involucrata TaxID=16924 RepID=A0A5B7BNH0_DAVIN
MGFCMNYSASSHDDVLYKAAFVFAVTRWVLSWLALRLLLTNIRDYIDISFSSSDVDSLEQSTSPLPLGSSSSKVIRDCLNSTTFGDITERRLPADQNSSCDSDTSSTTCAVCLEGLKKQDPVRELGNCCHLFHRRCLDTWLDHDSHQTCPLCRAPLLSTTTIFSSSSSAGMSSQQQPSWTVERILYLFGDDLLP